MHSSPAPSQIRRLALPLAALFFCLSSQAQARPFRVGQIPNGQVNPINGCGTCHTNPNGGGARNPFGQTVEASFLVPPGATGNVQWGFALADIDSDGDGRRNGVELLDPLGDWAPPDPNPGNPANVRNPGVIDAPPSVPLFSLSGSALLGSCLLGLTLLAASLRQKRRLVPL